MFCLPWHVVLGHLQMQTQGRIEVGIKFDFSRLQKIEKSKNRKIESGLGECACWACHMVRIAGLGLCSLKPVHAHAVPGQIQQVGVRVSCNDSWVPMAESACSHY